MATQWTGVTCSKAAVLDLNGNTVYLATSPSPVFGNRSYIYGTGDVTNNGGSFAYLIESSAPAGTTYSGTISDGSSTTILVHASGSLTILTPQTYTDLTLVQSGILALGGAGTLASRNIFLTGSADTTSFDISQTTSGATITNIYGSSTIALGSKTLTITNANGYLTGPIQDGGLGGGGGGSLVISGQLNLGGHNTYTGATTITASGDLALFDCNCGSDLIATSSGVVNNGIFDISNLAAGTPIKSLSGDNEGYVYLGANTLTLTNASGTYDGILSGSGNLIVSGGRETLTADSSLSFAGDTTIGTGATIILGNGAALGTGAISMSPYSTLGFTTGGIVVANAIALSGDPTITVAAGNTNTIAGVITDATPGQSPGILEKDGGGTLILTGANSYSGGTTISAGTLQIGNSGALGASTAPVSVIGGTLDLGGTAQATGALTLQNGLIANGTLTSSSFGVQGGTISAILAGSGTLTKTGAGTTLLTGANTYSGGTTISAGTLQIGNNGTLGASTALVSVLGGLLDLGGTAQTTGALTLQNGLIANGTLTSSSFGVQGGTISAILAGSGALTKTGAGTAILTGANSYSGGTTISAGTLQIGNSGALGASTAPVSVIGGTLDLGGTAQTTGALTLQNGLIANGTLTSSSFGVQGGTISAILAGSGALTKTGAGTAILTGANSYSGGTTISAGTLQLGTGATLGANTALVGVLGGMLDLGGTIQTTGALTLQNGLIANGTLTSSSFGVQGGTISAILAGSGALTKTGAGTTLLTGANSYSGGTTISAGTLQIGNGGTLGASTGLVGILGGTLDLGGTAQATGALTLQNGLIANGTLTSSSFGVQGGTISAILAGSGALTKTGAGTTLLTGANTYSGGTTISAGTLQLGTGATLGANTALVSVLGGMLDLGGTAQTTGALTLQNGLIANGTLTSSSFGVQGGTISAILAGSGALTKTGAGTTLLTGANTYSGGTTISAGTLQIGNSGTLGASTAPVSVLGGTLDLGGTTQATGALTLQNGLIANGTLTSSSFGVQGGTISAILAGSGALTKTGAGTAILTGANSYSGGTTISAGTLQIGNGATLGASTAPVSVLGGTLDLGGTAQTTGALTLQNGLIANGTLTSSSFGVQGGTISAILAGSGALTKTGAGTAILTGANSYSGGTTISAGTLQIGNGGTTGSITGAVADAGTLTFAWSNSTGFAGSVTGSGGVIQSGPSRLILSGKNLYSGPTTVVGGTLAAGAVGTLSPNSDVTLATGASLDVGGFNQTIGSLAGSGFVANSGTASATLTTGGSQASTRFSGVLQDGGAPLGLTKAGTGTLVLSGANLYSGATVVAGGTLAAGASQSFSPHSSVTVDRGATLDLFGFSQTVGSLAGAGTVGNTGPLAAALTVGGNNQSTTFAGKIQDDGPIGLTKVGSGTLVLSGANTYTGPTIISAGTLDVQGSITNSPVTVEDGAILVGSGDVGGLTLGAGSVVAPGSVTPFHTLLIQGDLDFTATSSLQIVVDASGRTDSVSGFGKAHLAGASLDITARPGLYSPTTLYTLVTAAKGVADRFGSISLDSDLVFMDANLAYHTSSVTLSFDVSPGALASAAITRNQSSMATAIQGLPLGDPFYTLVLNQTIAGARQAFDASSGEIHASAVTAAIEDSHLVRDAIVDRLDVADPSTIAAFAALGGLSGAVAPPSPRPYSFWGQGFGDFGRNGGDHNAATLDRSVGGFILGGDAMLQGPLSSWRIGVAGAFTNDTIDAKDRASTGRVETIHGLFYAGAHYGAIDLKFGAGGGDLSTVVNRTVTFPGLSEVEHSNQGGSLLQAFGEWGYRFAFARAVIEPTAAVAAIHVHENGFHEDGGEAALLGFAHDQAIGVTTLGIKGDVALALDTPFFAHAFLGWRHAFGDIDPQARVALMQGSPTFLVEGAPIDRDALVAKAGLDWRATSNLTVGAGYSGQLGARAQNHALQGKLEFSF